MRHHSEAEIRAKLGTAQQLLARGQSQAEACKELGVSVMTYHRWRKLYIAEPDCDGIGPGGEMVVGSPLTQSHVSNERQIDEVRAENKLLRRIATELLLEKAKAEERLATAFRGATSRRN